MSLAKPSLDLLRSLTDRHVIRALMREPRLTRAELSDRTGISKPTASESVRRLTQAGLLQDTGERTTGRGRIGSYYALAAGLGSALAVSIAPEGVVAERLDLHGRVQAREEKLVASPARPAQLTRALRTVARRAVVGGVGPIRLAVVSAADPVDRPTGRLVHLPDAPFLLGDLSPVDALAPLVQGPVVVDNDVNWAARAERHLRAKGELDDFAYLHLGAGLGCAVVSDGEVRRGHGGLAGEIAHVLTRGPDGRAVHLTEVFAELGLRRPGTTAIDAAAVLALVSTQNASQRTVLAQAVSGVLAALVAVSDPRLVLIGGSWGSDPAMIKSIGTEFARLPRSVPVQAARLVVEPSLTGARRHARNALRDAVLVHALGESDSDRQIIDPESEDVIRAE